MATRLLLGRHVLSSTRSFSTAMKSSTATAGPIQASMEKKLTAGLAPHTLRIHNDSHKHAHHTAMREMDPAKRTGETHFRVEIVSDAFVGKLPVARHRLVYGLLEEEMSVGGVHALQLSTRTVAEQEKTGAA